MEHSDFKEALEKDEKEKNCECFKCSKKFYKEDIEILEVIEHEVVNEECKKFTDEEIDVEIILCPSCLLDLLDANKGYAECEKCGKRSKSTGSICVDPGRIFGPMEDCYPPEYADLCDECSGERDKDF